MREAIKDSSCPCTLDSNGFGTATTRPPGGVRVTATNQSLQAHHDCNRNQCAEFLSKYMLDQAELPYLLKRLTSQGLQPMQRISTRIASPTATDLNHWSLLDDDNLSSYNKQLEQAE